MSQTLIGIVGYYPFVRGYPLGPELREKLENSEWQTNVIIKELNWGPVAIVQEFQAEGLTFDRAVLIAPVRRGRRLGFVHSRRWVGGDLPVMEIQNRMFEAVTGIVSIDNLLVIGDHFGIWPKNVIVVEVELADDCIGDMILQEYEKGLPPEQAVGEGPITSEQEQLVNEIFLSAVVALNAKASDLTGFPEMSVGDLNPLAEVCHNHLLHDIPQQDPLN